MSNSKYPPSRSQFIVSFPERTGKKKKNIVITDHQKDRQLATRKKNNIITFRNIIFFCNINKKEHELLRNKNSS